MKLRLKTSLFGLLSFCAVYLFLKYDTPNYGLFYYSLNNNTIYQNSYGLLGNKTNLLFKNFHIPASAAILRNASESIDNASSKITKPQDSYGNDMPSNFIEVKKTNPKKSSSSNTNMLNKISRKYLSAKELATRKAKSDLYQPSYLKARAQNISSLRTFLSEMNYRAKWIDDTCKNISKRSAELFSGSLRGDMRGPPRMLSAYRSLLIDRPNHLAFCPVYKAASTSWSITLLELKGIWKKRGKRRLQEILHHTFPAISNLAGPSASIDSTSFMVVRHPLERLVSCYRDKFENAKKDFYYMRYGEKMVKSYREVPPEMTSDEKLLQLRIIRRKIEAKEAIDLPNNIYANPPGPTFPEFVNWITRMKHEDEHWRPYYVHCSPCHIHYDVILRFEKLSEEGELFLEYLNRSSEVETRWANVGGTGQLSTSEVACSYYNQLSVKQIQNVIVKYEVDLLLFNYTADAYLKCAHDYKQKLQYAMLPTG